MLFSTTQDIPVSVNKVVLEHTTIHLQIVYVFLHLMSELSSCNRDPIGHKTLNI